MCTPTASTRKLCELTERGVLDKLAALNRHDRNEIAYEGDGFDNDLALP